MTELIVTSSVLILVIAAMRHFLQGKISLRLQYALWGLVLLRLLLPTALFESSLSVMNAYRRAEAAYVTTAESMAPPVLTSPYGKEGSESPAAPAGQAGALSVTAEAPREINLGLVAQRIWAAGIAAVGLSLFISNLSFGGKLKKTRQPFANPGCPLPVYTVEALPSPCLFGLFKPAVYLTPDIAADPVRLRHVLAHETTHCRHGDHIWSVLRGLCLAVHWYNPLVWLAAARSRRDAELACDEGAILRIGEGARTEYGRTLIGLTCEKRSAMDLLCCATTMNEGRSGIKERITLIAKRPKTLIRALLAAILIAALAVGCTFTGAKTDVTPAVPLTAEEVAAYNKTFEPLLFDGQGNSVGINPLTLFLTSYYDKPQDINLAELLRYYPSDADVTDTAEFEALKAAPNWPFGQDATLSGMPVPIHKFNADTVEDALKKTLDIGLSDLSGAGADELIYLKAYDAYYNFTSDAGFGVFTCTGGEKQGDTVRLFSDAATLTLKTKDDGFIILSHQQREPAKPQSADATLYPLGGLTLAIPNEMAGQVLTLNPDPESADGLLISVYEKKSYEDGRADLGEDASLGLLFSILRYTRAQYEQFLCSDGSGLSFFAKDEDYYYGWRVPTDVQFYRSGMTSLVEGSDDVKAWQALNEACTAVRDDFAARNHLAPYSDREFWDREFTYDGEHLYAAYSPYHMLQDTAAQKKITWTLILSQPATGGKTGIWCVERWIDENGNIYPYFPDANGLPAAQYYAEEQAQCDAGHKPGMLDPKQTALDFILQYFGHEGVPLDAVTVGREPPAPQP